MGLEVLVPVLQSLPGLSGRVAISATILDALEAPAPQDKFVWLAGPHGVSDPERSLGRVRQQWHDGRFTVVTLVRNLTDPTGAAALGEMEVLRRAVVGALLDRQIDPAYEPIAHVRQASLRFKECRLYWGDEFQTGHYIYPASEQ